MKFNPEEWQEVKANEKIGVSQGRLWLRLTQAAPVLVTSNAGVETLVAFDKEVDVEVTDCAFAQFTDKAARGWVYVHPVNAYEPDGEVFTNADRMPYESGSVNEVTAALRMFKLEQRAILREARAELNEITARRDALIAEGDGVPVDADEGESQPEPQPELEPAQKAKK